MLEARELFHIRDYEVKRTLDIPLQPYYVNIATDSPTFKVHDQARLE